MISCRSGNEGFRFGFQSRFGEGGGIKPDSVAEVGGKAARGVIGEGNR